MMPMRSPWRRVLLILALLLSGVRMQHAARAASPILVLSPVSNLPHGTETISGSGFDPLAPVTLSLTSSAGIAGLGSVTTDGAGTFVDTIALPLALDATAPNVLTAQEAGRAVSASASLLGLPVMPRLGDGQQITGRIGQTLSLYAFGFAPQEPITVTIGGVPALLPEGVTQLVTTTEGTANLTVGVPIAAPPGQDLLTAAGSVTGLGQHDSASLPINVVANQNLVATPNPAAAGRSLEVAGSGFAPDEPIAITFSYTDTVAGSSQLSADARADSGGGLEAHLTVPPTAQAASTATLIAHGAISGLNLSVGLTIVGQPTISVSQTTTEPGDHLDVSGSGFQPGERLFVSSALFATPNGGIIVDGSGSFTLGVTVRAPVAAGAYTVAASGVVGDQATTRVIVPAAPIPLLQIAPTTASPGAEVRVTGARFLAGEPVQLSLGATVITPTSGPITATTSGAFDVTVQIPATPASGIYPLTARGLRTGARGSLALHVQLPPVSQVYFAEGFTGQGPAVNFGESISVLNTNAVTATGQIEYFVSNGVTSTVKLTVPARSHISEDVVHDVGNNQAVSALVQMDQTVTATRTISRTTATGSPLGESVTTGERDLSPVWYFAEGYTGVSFQEYLELFNPGNTPASVVVQPAGTTGAAPAAPIDQTVPPHSRATINLRALLPNRQLGLIVQSDQPIAAERTLYWGDGAGSGKFGTSVSSGLRAPAALWTFPYASTAGGDQVFLTFLDPTTVAAHVRLTAYSDTGSQGIIQTVTVEPGARATLALPARSAGPLAIVASSDVPVIGEEAQYFGGSPNVGMHTGSTVAGVQQPAAQWIFPGFATNRYTTEGWYILNTGPTEARLTATLYSVQAQPLQVRFRAAPGRLTSVTVQNMNQLQSGSPSTWTSTAPVVIVQVLHGSNAATAALVAGVAPDQH